MSRRVSTRLMNICVASLCQARRLDAAERVLADGIRLGCLPDVVTYNTLVAGYCRLVGVDAAYSVLRRMREAGLRPDAVTYNSLIAGSARRRRLPLSLDLIEEMLCAGLRPDVWTYNNLMRCLFESGCPEQALRVVMSLESNHVAPSQATYNILIDGLCKCGNAGDALRVFRYLERAGFPGDVVRYNTLIDGLFRSGRLGQARRVFREMVASGCVPNAVTYTTMMKGYFRSRRFTEGLGMIDEMIRRMGWCRFDAFAYCTVIGALIKMGRMEEASDFLEEMSERCGVLDRVCYNTHINLCFRLGRVDDALNLLLNKVDEMDEYTVSIVVDGLCRNNRLPDAYNLLRYIESSTSSRSNLVPFNCFIRALCKQGKPESVDFAMVLFNDMEGKDSFTYASLLDGLCRLGRFLEAFKITMAAITMGVSLPVSVRHAVLAGLRLSRYKLHARKLRSEIFKAKLRLQESSSRMSRETSEG